MQYEKAQRHAARWDAGIAQQQPVKCDEKAEGGGALQSGADLGCIKAGRNCEGSRKEEKYGDGNAQHCVGPVNVPIWAKPTQLD